MLSARRAPRCRRQLQSILQNGATRTQGLRIPRTAALNTQRRKAFSTSSFRCEDKSTMVGIPGRIDTIPAAQTLPATPLPETPLAETSLAEPSQVELEETVRSARQTFGETLPRDFLSEREYTLYCRLYGAPTRETTYEDIEVSLAAEEEAGARQHNVLLQRNEEGEYEEVEMGEEYSGEGLSSSIEASIGAQGESLDAEQRKELRKAEEELLAAMERTMLGMSRGEMPAEIVSEEIENDAEEMDGEMAAQEAFAAEQMETFGGHIEGHTEREAAAIARLHKDMEAAQKEANEELLKEEEEDFEVMNGEKAYEQGDAEVAERFEEEEGVATYMAQDNWGEDAKGLFEGEEGWGEDEYDGSLGSEVARSHPYTRAGKSGTTPSTIFLPAETLVQPMDELLRRSDIKHLTVAAEKAFGGRGLPHSASTPGSEAMKQLPQKHIGLEPWQNRMSEIEADAYMAVVMPSVYATVMSTLVEMRKRLGAQWLRDMLLREDGKGPSVLDAGAGGAGALAFKDVMQAEWDTMGEEGLIDLAATPHPPSKLTVLCTPSTLRERVAVLLADTTLLHKLPDYVHSANGADTLDGSSPYNRKAFDLVLAPHTLLPLAEEYKRKTQIQNMWALTSGSGGVLLMIEKGLPRGFEAIAHARSLLLAKHIASPGNTHVVNNNLNNEDPDVEKEKGMIIAPCTNHSTCPMYPVEGFSAGRKDFCHFNQRYIRPPFYQRVIGASHRNHEDVKYSYIAVRRGVDTRASPDGNPSAELVQGKVATDAAFRGHEAAADAEKSYHDQGLAEGFSTLCLPRVVNEPLKRQGHVSMDVCTPSGTLERWTVPKSFSAQAYRDSRKTRWGDLWALGAKTRVERAPRLGKPADKAKEVMRAAKKKGTWKGRDISEAEKKRRKGADNFDITMGDQGMEGVKHRTGGGEDRSERRTKGGRIFREKKVKYNKHEKEVPEDDIY